MVWCIRFGFTTATKMVGLYLFDNYNFKVKPSCPEHNIYVQKRSILAATGKIWLGFCKKVGGEICYEKI